MTTVSIPLSMTLEDRFVELATRRDIWKRPAMLTPLDKTTITLILNEAGFGPTQIVWGRLRTTPLEGDHVINKMCPYQVVGARHQLHLFATGWLDCVVRRIGTGKNMLRESPAQLAIVLRQEIQRSRPLAHIQLNECGDVLMEAYPKPLYHTDFPYFVEHLKENERFSSPIGFHRMCEGRIERQDIPEPALVCRRCHMQVKIPSWVMRYADLRTYLQKNKPLPRARLGSLVSP